MTGEFILYNSEDGRTQVRPRVIEGTVWLNQIEMAELFLTTKQNVSVHFRNILTEGELQAEATVKESLTVQTEGERQAAEHEREVEAELKQLASTLRKPGGAA